MDHKDYKALDKFLRKATNTAKRQGSPIIAAHSVDVYPGWSCVSVAYSYPGPEDKAAHALLSFRPYRQLCKDEKVLFSWDSMSESGRKNVETIFTGPVCHTDALREFITNLAVYEEGERDLVTPREDGPGGIGGGGRRPVVDAPQG